MAKILVDEGKDFDFGKTSKLYGQYRDIYPEELYNRLHEIGIGVKGSKWLDLGTGTGVVPRGMAKYGAEIVATDISENQIEQAKTLAKEANMDVELFSPTRKRVGKTFTDLMQAANG